MRLLLKQYLSSLKEREELDAILPDILTEAGYTVVSRPMRGTAQYGVDAVAIGPHPTMDEKALFLLSIKSGNLTRSTWSDGEQAMKPSLEDILEVYIPTHVPAQYKNLPIFIALCFGGDVQETIRLRLTKFIDQKRVPDRIDFVEWNGDIIAGMMATGILREKLFPPELQSSFRKAVALVDEPAVCVGHFAALLGQLGRTIIRKPEDRVRVSRQIYLATWTIFVWARDAGNLDSAYQASSLAILYQWHLSNAHFSTAGAGSALNDAMQKALQFNHTVSGAFLVEHVEPYASIPDGLGHAVPSMASVDVNLKLFEILGRVALHGLWLLRSIGSETLSEDAALRLETMLDQTQRTMCDLINNNSALNAPLRDDHAIEIMLACLFLGHRGNIPFIRDWVDQIALNSLYAFRLNGAYPCVFQEYSDLALHPQPGAEYRVDATIGSVLHPTIAVWAALVGNDDLFAAVAAFKADHMQHSTWQLWVPDEISERHLYTASSTHGAAISDLPFSDGPTALVQRVVDEANASTDFDGLSAMRFGCWPLVLAACRLHRLPVPPHFWFSLGPRQDEARDPNVE